MIVSSFPNYEREVVDTLFAVIRYGGESEKARVLGSFLRNLYKAWDEKDISVKYFAFVMKHVIAVGVEQSHGLEIFGGFMTDILPTRNERLAGVFLHVVPIVLHGLLLQRDFLAQTASLVTSLLSVCDRFPRNLGIISTVSQALQGNFAHCPSHVS